MAADADSTDHPPAVRRFAAGDLPAATTIVRGLPDYFTDDVPAKVEHDAARHEAWAVTDPLLAHVLDDLAAAGISVVMAKT
jgi:hypothetical protein